MAQVTVGTIGGVMTAAQLKTALDAALTADLTRQGSSNSRTYRCVDNLLLQGDIDAEGFTFICAPGKTVYFGGSAASPGVVRTSTYVDGVPFLPVRIVYEGETPFGEHDVTQETQGFLRNCGMDVGRLEIVITGDTTSNYYGVPFLTAQKTVIRELVVSNQNQSGLCYTNFNLTHAQSSVRVSSIRNSTIRVSSATLDFGFVGDAGWAFGEGGTQDVKLLSPNNSRTVGLAPKFLNSSGTMQFTAPDFTATTRILRDSFIAPSRITMYPTGNDSTVAEVERTVTYKPQASEGSALTGVMARVLSTRTITGAAGVTAGATMLHTGSVNTNGTQVFRVWKGFNSGPTAGAYQPAQKIIDDNALTIDYRQCGRIGAQLSLSGYLGAATATAGLAVDADFTGTSAQAAAITGVAFVYDAATGTLAVAVTQDIKVRKIYNAWCHFLAQPAQMGAVMVPANLLTMVNGVLTVTGTLGATGTQNAAGVILTTAAITADPGDLGIKTTGAITLSAGGSIALPFEDSAGVRVTITKQGGGNFNILARHRSGSGSYTSLGFSSGVSTVTYTVPKGNSIEVVMWSLGCVTYSRTISTANGGVSFAAEMTVNAAINTSLDVSSYLADIALSLDTSGATPKFVITFNAAVVVAGIELGKAIIHRLSGLQVALAAGLPPGVTSAIAISPDEILNNLPSVRLDLGSSLTVTDRVYLDFFINTVPALVVDSAYVINPPRADGNQVQILRAKPALDASILAAQSATAVRAILAPELARIDVATSTLSTLTTAQIPAGLTVAQIEASTILAKEATVAAKASQASVTALAAAVGAPLQTGDYTAPTTPPTTADIKAALEVAGGKLDRAMNAAISADDNTT